VQADKVLKQKAYPDFEQRYCILKPGKYTKTNLLVFKWNYTPMWKTGKFTVCGLTWQEIAGKFIWHSGKKKGGKSTSDFAFVFI
jgi:hypothetical protein